jgi:uncharacterized membrane protein
LRPETNNLVLFLGHFHPLLVHLPIGGLVLIGVLELLARFTRWKDAAQNGRAILGFVCATGLISVLCGLMLEKAGGYEPQLLKWHRAAGLGVAGVSVITLLFRHLEWRCTYRVCLATAVLLLVIAGHSGGSITHGREFLTQYAPVSVRAFLGESRPGQTEVEGTCSPMERPVFTGIIEPILLERCQSCHGAEKHKGDLRLDTLEGLLRGGQDGPVVKAGQATDSPLVQSMLSPLDADGHMPPEDHPQPSAEEISLIEWWINKGAPAAARVVDLKPEPEIQRLFKIVSTGHEQAN